MTEQIHTEGLSYFPSILICSVVSRFIIFSYCKDNEPLMRSLTKLISVNAPDLVLFVGEALVGNEAIDQLVKFNAALADHSHQVYRSKAVHSMLTLYTVLCTLFTVAYPVSVLCTVHYTLYTVLCTLNTVLCTLCIVPCTRYTIHCTLYNIIS